LSRRSPPAAAKWYIAMPMSYILQMGIPEDCCYRTCPQSRKSIQPQRQGVPDKPPGCVVGCRRSATRSASSTIFQGEAGHRRSGQDPSGKSIAPPGLFAAWSGRLGR
jgi:hypothetical protein